MTVYNFLQKNRILTFFCGIRYSLTLIPYKCDEKNVCLLKRKEEIIDCLISKFLAVNRFPPKLNIY